MSVTIVPNSGILQNDRLDELRKQALTVCNNGLPDVLVEYLRALEKSHMNHIAEDRKRWRNEIDWKISTL